MIARLLVRLAWFSSALVALGAPSVVGACENEMQASSPYARAATALKQLRAPASSDPTAVLLLGLVLILHLASLPFFPAAGHRAFSLFALAIVVTSVATLLGAPVQGQHAAICGAVLLLVALAHVIAERRARAAARIAEAILSGPAAS